MSLADQILQRWGRYGNWQSADQNQAADLARLFEANGITDLSRLNFKKREYEVPGQEWETEAGMQRTDPTKRTTFDVLYGDQNLGFLGDINRDGSLSKLAKDYLADGSGPQLTDRGDNGPILGWSSRGGGHTNFNLVESPTGEVVVMPNWGSSKTQTYNDLRGIASILGLAAGAYYAPAGGAAGAAAQGGLQGYGLASGASLLGDGDVNSTVNAGLAGGVTGAVAGGVKGYGQSQGWNPATTRAVTGGANAALRGGSGEDILKGAVGGYLSGSGGKLVNNFLPGDMKTEPGFFDQGGPGYAGGGNGMDFDWGDFDYSGGAGGWSADDLNKWLKASDLYGANNDIDWGNFNFAGDTSGGATADDLNRWLGKTDLFGADNGGFDWGKAGGAAWKWLTSGSGKDGNGIPPWAMLAGAGLGLLDSRDKEATSSRDPWKPMQPYLLGLADDGRGLYNQYKAQPFSQAQQTAYGNVGGLLDTLNANAGGLLQGMQANATGQNQFVRGKPQRLVGSAPVNGDLFTPGLLGNFGTRRG